MTQEQSNNPPEALRLAAWLREGAWHHMTLGDVQAAGRELTRLAAVEDGFRAQHDADSRELRSLCAQRDEARRERDALRAQVEALTRDTERQASKITELAAELVDREARHRVDKQRLQAIHEHQEGECWYWQGGGQDHLESMVNSLPVVIRADQLRELLAEARNTAAAPTRPAVPKGWPTNEMIEAGRRAANTHGPLLGNGQSLWHVFRDMLAAASQADRCTSCDGTGDVTDHTGEWRGYCICSAALTKLKAQKGGA